MNETTRRLLETRSGGVATWIDSIEKQVQQLTATLSQLSEENRALRQRGAALESLAQQKSSECARLADLHGRTAADNSRLRQQLAASQRPAASEPVLRVLGAADAEQQRARIASLEADVQARSAAVQQLETKLRRAEDALQQRQSDAAVEQQRARIASLEADVQARSAAVQQLETKLRRAEDALQQRQSDAAALQQQLRELEASRARLVDESDARIRALEEHSRAQQAQVEQLTRQNQQRDTELQVSRANNQRCLESLQQLTAERRQRTDDSDAAQDDSARVQELQAQLAHCQAAAQHSLAAQQQQLQSAYEAQLAQLSEQMRCAHQAQLQHEQANYEAQLHQLQSTHQAQLQQVQSTYEAQLQQLQSTDAPQLSEQLQSTDAPQLNEQSAREAQEMQAQVAQLTEQLRHSRRQYDQLHSHFLQQRAALEAADAQPVAAQQQRQRRRRPVPRSNCPTTPISGRIEAFLDSEFDDDDDDDEVDSNGDESGAASSFEAEPLNGSAPTPPFDSTNLLELSQPLDTSELRPGARGDDADSIDEKARTLQLSSRVVQLLRQTALLQARLETAERQNKDYQTQLRRFASRDKPNDRERKK